MNNRFEARARQTRTTALLLTFLFHLALIGGIYYYNLDNKAAKQTENVSATEQKAATKPVANIKRSNTKP